MPEELLPTPETDADSEELDFTKSDITKLDMAQSRVMGINPARWERAIEEVDFQDLVEEFTGHRSNDKISCPFHGSDSTPAFAFFPHKNNGWCFGCPPGQQFYDTITFTAKTLSVSRLKALVWLEKKFGLPPIDDIKLEDEEEDEEVQVELADLTESYIRQARREVQQLGDVELATGYIQKYFEAERENDALALARVLDPSTLQTIVNRKLYR
jgi:hypothetical protein